MANEDWDEALRRIEITIEKSQSRLNLSGLTIDIIPEEVAQIRHLRSLNLSNTKIYDTSVLSQIPELKSLNISKTLVEESHWISEVHNLTVLDISDTSISDIEPLQQLRFLEKIDLSNTPVSDVSPLMNLGLLRDLSLRNIHLDSAFPTSILEKLVRLDIAKLNIRNLSMLSQCYNLQSIWLDGEQANDLQSILLLPIMQDISWGGGLGIRITNGLELARPSIQRAFSKSGRDEQRIELLDILQSSMPFEESNRLSSSHLPQVPNDVPAPLHVYADDDGQIFLVDKSDQTAGTRAAWHALRDILEDLDDLRPNIGNAMPRLAKALVRVDTALGQTSEACNPIHLGIHGTRVIALAELADDALMEEAATEIRSFAALLALHLQRFPEWHDYETSETFPDAEGVEAARPALAEVTEALNADGVDPRVPETLDDLIAANEDEPGDGLLRKGLLDSARNTWSGIFRWIVQEAKDIGSRSWNTTKTVIGGAAATGILLIVQKSTGALTSLATNLPTAFGWLKPVLAFLGL